MTYDQDKDSNHYNYKEKLQKDGFINKNHSEKLLIDDVSDIKSISDFYSIPESKSIADSEIRISYIDNN